jgi:hypothetical protein
MKGTTLLSTAPKSPLRSRKPKSATVQSVRATVPVSPTRRARLAIMNQAKHCGAPLKVQMEAEINFTTFVFVKGLLDPRQPVKKKPLFNDVFQISDSGEPVKKRVTPWLVADPECAFGASMLPR